MGTAPDLRLRDGTQDDGPPALLEGGASVRGSEAGMLQAAAALSELRPRGCLGVPSRGGCSCSSNIWVGGSAAGGPGQGRAPPAAE